MLNQKKKKYIKSIPIKVDKKSDFNNTLNETTKQQPKEL